MGLKYEKTFDILSSPLSFEYPASKSYKAKNYKYSLIGSWSNHYNSWKTYKSCEVLIVKYEEMLSDPAGTFYKILEYLDKIDDVKIDSEKFGTNIFINPPIKTIGIVPIKIDIITKLIISIYLLIL